MPLFMSLPPYQPSHHGESSPLGPREPERDGTALEQDLKRNFIVLFFHGMLGQTGFRLLQAPTFLPTYIATLTGSNAAAGMARAIQSLGSFVSPMVSARMIEHRTHVKRMAIGVGALMRLQILFLALIALFLPRELAIYLVWIAIGVWGLASGMQMVVFNFLLSKAIPIRHRGRLHGFRNLTSAITLLVVSAVAGWLLDRYGFPTGYGWAFLLSFVLTSSGLVFLLLLCEPPSEETRAPVPFLDRIRLVPVLLRDEPEFSRFVKARLFATAARAALPFYILTIREQVGLSGQQIGWLTMSFALSQGICALLWGFFADRSGFKAVFVGSMVCWLLANGLILLSPTLEAGYGIFFLVGAGLSGFQMAGVNLVLEFGDQKERAMRLATTHSFSELIGGLAYVAAAVAAATIPLAAIFVGAIGLQLLSLHQLSGLTEPRHA
jgi:MFS family permease